MVWQWQRSRSDRRRSIGAGIEGETSALGPHSDGQAEDPFSDPAFVAGLRPIPSGARTAGDAVPAPDFTGTSPSGRPVRVVVGEYIEPLLLAFLHVDCDGCHEFWQGLRDDRCELPASVSAVVVTKGPETVPPGEVGQAALGIGRIPVVMSDDAWTGYRVMGYPFFVLVEPSTRTIVGETVGFGWPDVVSMIRSSLG